MPRSILQRLGLPYRVVLLAAGDTGFGSAKTYDLEMFAPGVGKWLEVLELQLFTDFQARRGKHPISARAGREAAVRAHAQWFRRSRSRGSSPALLEHCQQPDGSASRIPEALQPYFGRAELR